MHTSFCDSESKIHIEMVGMVILNILGLFDKGLKTTERGGWGGVHYAPSPMIQGDRLNMAVFFWYLCQV